MRARIRRLSTTSFTKLFGVFTDEDIVSKMTTSNIRGRTTFVEHSYGIKKKTVQQNIERKYDFSGKLLW